MSKFTAKLVLQNGHLREFNYPVRVSDLLQQNPSCFVCSADEMEFDRFAVEIGGGEMLSMGEVYFELPLEWRRQRLTAEDMAALAVKASLALSTSGGGGGGYEYDDDEMIISCGGCYSPRKVEPMVSLFSEKKEEPPRAPVVAVEGDGRKGRRKFVAKLSAINEE